MSGAPLQLHLHAQHTEPLRPADRRARHGGTVHNAHYTMHSTQYTVHRAMSRLFVSTGSEAMNQSATILIIDDLFK